MVPSCWTLQSVNPYDGFSRWFPSPPPRIFDLEITVGENRISVSVWSWCWLWQCFSQLSRPYDLGGTAFLQAWRNAPLVKFPHDSSWHLEVGAGCEQEVCSPRRQVTSVRVVNPRDLVLVGRMNQRGVGPVWWSSSPKQLWRVTPVRIRLHSLRGPSAKKKKKSFRGWRLEFLSKLCLVLATCYSFLWSVRERGVEWWSDRRQESD